MMEYIAFGAITILVIWLLADQCNKWAKDRNARLNGEAEAPKDGLLLRLWKRRR
jgi:hypothetical protein